VQQAMQRSEHCQELENEHMTGLRACWCAKPKKPVDTHLRPQVGGVATVLPQRWSRRHLQLGRNLHEPPLEPAHSQLKNLNTLT
jgi:hypothetical protein